MPMVRAMRMLNAIEAGTLTGAQLETLLTSDRGRLAEWNQLLAMRGDARRLAASQTSMTAAMGSPTAWAAVVANAQAMAAVLANSQAWAAVVANAQAMAAVAANAQAMAAVAANAQAMAAVAANAQAMAAVLANSQAWAAVVANAQAMAAVLANSQAMAAVLANSQAWAAVVANAQAMAAVWNSNTAADAVLTSAVGRNAVYESDVALAALQANPTQIARQIGISGRTQYASTVNSSFDFVANGTKVILLRRWYSGNEYDYLNWRRGSTSTGGSGGVIQPGGSRMLYGSWANGSTPGTYNDNGARCNSEGDHANFVAACNGLRRDSWAGGYTLYVRYILV